jgi:hypothetical protein
MSTIGERLAEEIRKRYREYQDFAKENKIAKETLSAYINNRRIPGPKWLERFKKAGLDVSYILIGERGLPYEDPKVVEQKFKELEKEIADLKTAMEKDNTLTPEEVLQKLKDEKASLEKDLQEREKHIKELEKELGKK